MLNYKTFFQRFTLFTILFLSVGNLGFATPGSPAGLVGVDSTPQPPSSPSAGSAVVYLPMMAQGKSLPAPDPTPVPIKDDTTPIVNAPYFNGDISFPEMAIFWFGKVTPTENYTDVRVGYNDQELVVYAAIFDRRLWYDETPSPDDLTNWDAVTLYLDTNGPIEDPVGQSAYRFDAQFTPFAEANSRTNYQAAYQGSGSGWAPSNTSFQTISGWRGDAWNNNQDDRGWTMSFHIPFSSLGSSGPPSNGKIWGIAMAVHDRDDSTGTPIADKTWPNGVNFNASSTWSQINFGLPVYHPPSAAQAGTATIRDKLNGAKVPDVAVGGTVDNLCNADGDFWTNWGNANFAGAPNINIQNQSDIADWPCYSKYFVSFPLNAVPAGKVILSAKLILHQWGNTGTVDLAKPSLIQIMTVKDRWDESTLTWNNAPLAQENVSQAWVDPVNCDVSGGLGWPCVPREWDVSRAVNQSYEAGKSLQLALYSADSDYHSGKLFTTSDTGDWNADGRPTLIVTWGNP